MAKLKYSFTVTEAPVSYHEEANVPDAIRKAAEEQGLDLVARVDALNGTLQLGTLSDGELKLVLVRVTAEKAAVEKGDDLRQEIQKMMFV